MSGSRNIGRVARAIHRVHRSAGSLLSLVLVIWFASGVVMTFARYPQFSDAERLASAPLLAADTARELPRELRALIDAGGLQTGSRVRLAQLEGQPVWTWLDADGPHRSWRASAPWTLPPLDATRARRVAEQRLGLRSHGAERLAQSDQWTVGNTGPSDFPLYRIQFDDRDATEAYVTAASGEIVQQSTRSERLLCWIGAIPHWVYPAMLRRERELWRLSVLWLAGAALIVAMSGLAAGIHAQRLRRRAAKAREVATPASSPRAREGNGRTRNDTPSVLRAPSPRNDTPSALHAPSPRNDIVRDPYLRWHQRLGLAFGVFVASWAFSGALSLNPFHWSGRDPNPTELAQIHAATDGTTSTARPPLELSRVLTSCSRELQTVELELAALGGSWVAVCTDRQQRTRVVDLRDPELSPEPRLGSERLQTLAKLAHADLSLQLDPDAYYYPTHADPRIALPYARLDVHDAEASTFYIDPSRAALVAHFNQRKRIERWLYHGLHSIDLPWLYAHPWLWRSSVIAAMLVGLSLTSLGLAMRVRRWWRQRARDARLSASR